MTINYHKSSFNMHVLQVLGTSTLHRSWCSTLKWWGVCECAGMCVGSLWLPAWSLLVASSGRWGEPTSPASFPRWEPRYPGCGQGCSTCFRKSWTGSWLSCVRDRLVCSSSATSRPLLSVPGEAPLAWWAQVSRKEKSNLLLQQSGVLASQILKGLWNFL